MRGPVARQAIAHLQAGRQAEALALLREHGKGSAALALLEHGFLDYSECMLRTCEAGLGQCPVSADYDHQGDACPQLGPPRQSVEATGRSGPPPVSMPTQTETAVRGDLRRKQA